MARDVIMPMLGMVQDTGTIVSWHKQPGDPVKATDVLMEVETDKATVEVEAGFDGFVAALKAETGVPVPVGQVVAVISDNKDEVEAAPAPAAAEEPKSEATAPEPAAPAAAPPPVSEKNEKPPPPPAPRPRSPVKAAGGRVLASPKARRLARERGVDLNRLVRLGVPEPIHVADLDKAGAMGGQASPSSMMRVTVARVPFDDFVNWVGEEAGAKVEAVTIWAAFAAGSLRVATGGTPDDDIVVEASRFDDADGPTLFSNPDRGPLSAIAVEPNDLAATIVLLDLTATMLTDYRQADAYQIPFLTVCNSQDPAHIDLYLEFDPAMMPAPTAYAFLKELADRTQVPLRHVL